MKEALPWAKSESPLKKDLQAFEEYTHFAQEAGPHSFHGKFYRKEAAKHEQAAVARVEEVLKDSGIVQFSFENLLKLYQAKIGSFTRPADLLDDIITAGKGVVEEDADLEELVVIGTIAMGEKFSFDE